MVNTLVIRSTAGTHLYITHILVHYFIVFNRRIVFNDKLLSATSNTSQELAMLENANNRLRRMENRLDLATKRFCMVNSDNKHIREEIHRLLVERLISLSMLM